MIPRLTIKSLTIKWFINPKPITTCYQKWSICSKFEHGIQEKIM